MNLPDSAPPAGESPAYLQEQVITYIGNKRALLPFIGQAVAQVQARLGKRQLDCLDLFAGTGIVARYLKQHARHLLANDLELYSAVTNRCYLTNTGTLDAAELRDALAHLQDETARHLAPGFLAELYAPADDERIRPHERVFYTRRNAMFLDTARQQIARLPARLQDYFLAPLIAEASVHANTAGVFKGFYKSRDGIGQFGGTGRHALQRIRGDIRLQLPVLSRFDCEARVTREDANALVRAHAGNPFDLAYLDPPYNQHPYGSNYFMLNLVAAYERPRQVSPVSGIPADWNRSAYNRRQDAAGALFDVVDRCPARFVLLSYNSEGFIPQAAFVAQLERLGTLRVLETPYNAFRGSRNLAARATHVTEFLYLLEKR